MFKDYKTDFVFDSVLKTIMELSTCWFSPKSHMRKSDVRMQYFTKNWPVKGHATPCEMAEAGLYYLGDSSEVTVALRDYGQPWD